MQVVCRRDFVKRFGLTLLTFSLSLTGCNHEEKPYRKPTAVVRGQVVVDGVPPDSPIKIICHPQGEPDTTHPSISNGMTGENGLFELSTYEQGDGIPPGDYVLTFQWGKVNLVSMSYGGPDRLKGKYANPEKSPFKVTVTGDDPVDLGTLELTTK